MPIQRTRNVVFNYWNWKYELNFLKAYYISVTYRKDYHQYSVLWKKRVSTILWTRKQRRLLLSHTWSMKAYRSQEHTGWIKKARRNGKSYLPLPWTSSWTQPRAWWPRGTARGCTVSPEHRRRRTFGQNLPPSPISSARAWKSRFAWDLSFSSWWWMLDVYRVVSEQFNDELTQLIFAINMASGFQKWRACAGAWWARKKFNLPERAGWRRVSRREDTWTARMRLAARDG